MERRAHGRRSASASPSALPAAFLHHESEPAVARALLPSALTSPAYSAWGVKGPAAQWPTPLSALYAASTPLLAPSALGVMSTATTSVLTAVPPTPSLTMHGSELTGSAWRQQSSSTGWNSAASGGAAVSSAWTTEDQPPLQMSPMLRGRYASSSPLLNRMVAPMPPLALPPPPQGSAVAAKPVKKRKRVPGSQRLRNFLCMHPACGKSFTDSAHLRDHTVVHTGEKRLRCDICDRRFARLSTLHEHQRVHTGEKPYVCPDTSCLKRYSSRAALRVHVANHNGIVISRRRREGAESRALSTRGVDVTVEAESHFEQTSTHFDNGPQNQSSEYSYDRPPANSTTSAGFAESTSLGAYGEETAANIPAIAREEPEDPPQPDMENVMHPSPQVLENTIREQQDEIARLQSEIERLRQQPSSSTKSKSKSGNRSSDGDSTSKVAITAPVEFLQDGVKPFACCICSQRFVNYYQLTFHAKQHAGAPLDRVVGDNQMPLPVGPKFCPEHGCEYSEASGRSLSSLQTLKRHWQRCHQLGRPHVCSVCPPDQRKTFKTRENLKAHERDCRRIMAAAAAASFERAQAA